MPGPTLERERAGRCGFAYGTVALCGRPFHAGSATVSFVTAPGQANVPTARPTTPARQRFAAYTRAGLGLVRVRSPLLAQSRLISLPPATEMFQFAGLSSRTLFYSGADGRA